MNSLCQRVFCVASLVSHASLTVLHASLKGFHASLTVNHVFLIVLRVSSSMLSFFVENLLCSSVRLLYCSSFNAINFSSDLCFCSLNLTVAVNVFCSIDINLTVETSPYASL